MLTGDWTRSGGLAWRHVLQPRNGEAEPKCICPWWLGTRKLRVGANGWTCPARTGVTTVVLVLPGSQGAKERQKLGEADARQTVLPRAVQQMPPGFCSHGVSCPALCVYGKACHTSHRHRLWGYTDPSSWFTLVPP